MGHSPMLEVQLVDAADSIAYDAHDVDDAIQMGLLSIEELSELAVIRRALERTRGRHGLLPKSQLRQLLVHELIDLQVSDLLEQAVEALRPFEGHDTLSVSEAGLRLSHSDTVGRERSELESFLFNAVYRHERLIPVRKAASDRLENMFQALLNTPSRLPLRFRQRAESHPLESVVGEYIAGMTDTFCDTQYRYAIESSTGPLADW
ncbi:MAG: hypothetical protein ACPHJ3_19585 [Rubripirellula sp.]